MNGNCLKPKHATRSGYSRITPTLATTILYHVLRLLSLILLIIGLFSVIADDFSSKIKCRLCTGSALYMKRKKSTETIIGAQQPNVRNQKLFLLYLKFFALYLSVIRKSISQRNSGNLLPSRVPFKL